MKINEVEAAVGITKKNIRFYEEEGLLHPRRDAGNGYRDYSDADVERLRRIKLLRKLDVPLADIRSMLDGTLSFAQGMRGQCGLLQNRSDDLREAAQFCEELSRQDATLESLDVTAALQELENKERKGVTFVDVKKTDRKAERYRGAVTGMLLFTALMVLLIVVFVWAYLADPEGMPLPLMAAFVAIPLLCIAGVLITLRLRFSEIEKGEQDDYSNY